MPCKPFWGPKIKYLTYSCLECIYSFVCMPKMLWKPICHLKDQIRHINKMVPPWFHRLALFFVLQESKCHHLCHEVVFWSCYCLGKSSLSLSLARETLKIFSHLWRSISLCTLIFLVILQSYLLNFPNLHIWDWQAGLHCQWVVYWYSALGDCPKKVAVAFFP